MLQDGGAGSQGFGYPLEVVYVVVKACLGSASGASRRSGSFRTAARLVGAALGSRRRGGAAGPRCPFTDEAGFAPGGLGLHRLPLLAHAPGRSASPG